MGPKRHHYVPQFYLNYFAKRPPKGKKPAFWVYDKEGGLPRMQSPLNTAVVCHFYTLNTPEGERDPIVEKMFAQLESVTKPILERWQTPQARPERDEIPIVADFVAKMHCRVPRAAAFVEEMAITLAVSELHKLAESPERFKAVWTKFCNERGAPESVTFEEMQEALVDVEKKVKISLNSQVAMAFSMLSADTIFRELLAMNWCLCRAPRDASFITSDSPVNVFVPRGDKAMFGAGFRLKAVEIALPISPDVCLYLNRRTSQARRSVGERFVREINRRIVCMADRYIISPYNTQGVQSLVSEFAHTRRLPKTDKNALLEIYQARRNQMSNKE